MEIIEITLVDAFVSVFYLGILLFWAARFKNKISDRNTRKYFFPFFLFKLACAFLFVFLHAYVYRGGDTYLYFAGAKFIANQIVHTPEHTLDLFFGGYNVFNTIQLYDYTRVVNAFNDPATLLMCQITAIFFFLGFHQFLATTILISFFSAFGIWSLFLTLYKLYPKAIKAFAFGVLFYPSIGIWGSGILKDTITIAAICWIFSSFYNVLQRRVVLKSLLIILISIVFILKLKPYILYTFLPAMLLWAQSYVSKRIKSNFIKYSLTPLLIIITSIGGYFFLQTISKNAGKYSLENVQSIARGFQRWHTYLAEIDNQSGYSLGEVSYTPLGVLQKSPQALFVTYFRPTPFEIRNFATAFEAIQSFVLLLFTIYVLLKVGLLRFFRTMLANPEVRAFIFFSITLGVTVGITSYNFGALSRYKIPCLPFFTASLAIIYHTRLKINSRKIYGTIKNRVESN